jgi:hypothetical protein
MGKKIDIAVLNPVVKTLKYTTFISLSRAPGHAATSASCAIACSPHPETVSAYGDLKKWLAKQLAEDSIAYTGAKTHQDLLNKARRDRTPARRCVDGLN